MQKNGLSLKNSVMLFLNDCRRLLPAQSKTAYLCGFHGTLHIHGCSFCCQILMQIRYRVAFRLDIRRHPRHTGGRGGVHAVGVVNEIGVEAVFSYFILVEAAGKLMHYRTYHLKMRKLFGTYIRQDRLDLGVGHGEALAEVAK